MRPVNRGPWPQRGGANVTFVPYGFAETTEVDGGGYEFSCQHGADECYGNIVQACTIAHTEDRDMQVNLIVW